MWSVDGGVMWKDEYLIGNELIDNQHKALFLNATDNLLQAICNPGEYMERHNIVNSLNFLKEYAVQHFRDEEEFQLSIGYPGYKEHKAQHVKLAEDVMKYEKILVQSDFAHINVKKFLAFVLRWLMVHVSQEDKLITQAF